MSGFVTTAAGLPAVRRRLAVELHRRAYHDVGVEISPGPRAPDADRAYRIGTPHCKQGDRALGELRLGAHRWARSGERFGSWAELRREAFAGLGVERWRTPEHKGCFHRRGKARHDLVFAVAAGLLDDPPAPASREFWALAGPDHDPRYARLLSRMDDEVPADRPARHLAVSCCGAPLAVLCGDGRAVTEHGPLALDDLWWRGADVPDLVAELRVLARHTYCPPDRKAPA